LDIQLQLGGRNPFIELARFGGARDGRCRVGVSASNLLCCGVIIIQFRR